MLLPYTLPRLIYTYSLEGRKFTVISSEPILERIQLAIFHRNLIERV